MRNEQKVLIAGGEEEREREHPQQRRAQKKSSLWRASLSPVYAHANDAPPSQAAITRLKGKGNEFRNEDEEGWKEGEENGGEEKSGCASSVRV